MSFFDEMKPYALSDEQLSQCFEHKIISPNVANLIIEIREITTLLLRIPIIDLHLFSTI